MRVKFGDEWIADSSDVVLLHEPDHYPVAYFPRADVAPGVLVDTDRVTDHQDLGKTAWFTVRAGEHAAQRAAWQHSDLPGYADILRDRVAFAWRAMDAFYEEDERIVGHAADLYHRNDIRSTSRHLVVKDGERVIADSKRAAGALRIGLRAALVRATRRHRRSGAHSGRRPDLLPVQGSRQLLRHRRARPRGLVLSGRLAGGAPRARAGLVRAGQDRGLPRRRALELEPGQTVVPHGIDRGLTSTKSAPEACNQLGTRRSKYHVPNSDGRTVLVIGGRAASPAR